MRKKRFGFFIFTISTGLIFSACSLPANILTIEKESDDRQEIEKEEVAMASIDASMLSEEEIRMLELEYLEETIGISEAEYAELADIYERLGFVKSERDILEKSYRLYKNEETLERLSNIAVNISEEAEEISSLLSVEKNEKDILELLEREDFKNIVFPKLHDGKRTYFSEESGKVTFILQVSADDISTFAVSSDNRGIAVSANRYVASIFTSDGVSDVFSISEDENDRAFTKKTIDLYNGMVTIEEGTLKNGRPIGAYHVKSGSFDAYDLSFSEALDKLSEVSVTEYSGEFDENGNPSVEAPNAATLEKLKGSSDKNIVVYAYTADKKHCLYGEEGSALVNLDFVKPSLTNEVCLYEIKDRTGLTTDIVKDSLSEKVQGSLEEIPKVRVYDNEVQYFDGSEWVSFGSLETLAKNDPFAVYNNDKETVSSSLPQPKTVVESAEVVEKKEVASTSSGKSGSTGKAKANVSSTPKTTAPAVSQPVVQPVVQPVSPAPSEQPPAASEPSHSDPEPSHSDPEPSHSDPEPSTPPEPDNTEPEVEAGGLDLDEWTEDDK